MLLYFPFFLIRETVRAIRRTPAQNLPLSYADVLVAIHKSHRQEGVTNHKHLPLTNAAAQRSFILQYFYCQQGGETGHNPHDLFPIQRPGTSVHAIAQSPAAYPVTVDDDIWKEDGVMRSLWFSMLICKCVHRVLPLIELVWCFYLKCCWQEGQMSWRMFLQH